MYKNRFVKLFIIFLFFLSILYFYKNERSKKDIVFISTVALSGPLQEIGLKYSKGIETYFKAINDAGGINDAKIKFIVLDDKYEPSIAQENIKHLIKNQKNLFGILGTVGTPTSEEVLKLSIKSDIPFLMPFSGAEFLYSNKFKNVFTLRPSYNDEALEMVKYLKKNNFTNVAIFYQNDSYGLSALAAIEKAIQNTKIKILAEGIYNRNTISIHSAYQEIKKVNPQAVIMAGAYNPTIEFIRKASKQNNPWVFLNFSFVSIEPLKLALGDVKNKILITQVVPSLTLNDNATREYISLFKKYYPSEDPSSVSFEGFLAAKVIASALKQSPYSSRQSFLNTLSLLNIKLFDNESLVYSQNNHSGLKKVYLIEIEQNNSK